MENQLHVNQETVWQILLEDLRKRKICAKFVLHSAVDELKKWRVTASKDFIAAVIHHIHLTLFWLTFFYSLKWKLPSTKKILGHQEQCNCRIKCSFFEYLWWLFCAPFRKIWKACCIQEWLFGRKLKEFSSYFLPTCSYKPRARTLFLTICDSSNCISSLPYLQAQPLQISPDVLISAYAGASCGCIFWHGPQCWPNRQCCHC